MQKVVVLGASNKPERYSHKAVVMLADEGYDVVPVHPLLKEINGISVVPNLDMITDLVHTLTVYVGPRRIAALIPAIVALQPGRVILNPGAESEELEAILKEEGIPCIQACTLVLLSTGQFDES